MTIEIVMRHLNNFFIRGKHVGEIKLAGDKVVSPPTDAPYVYLIGSKQGEGVYETADPGAVATETFQGVAYALNPPRAFLEMVNEIADWSAKHPEDGLMSESFGHYSRTMAQKAGGGTVGWAQVFNDRLRPYRRMFSEV